MSLLSAMRKSETMTSRERVVKAINHQPVDRVPIDLGMHFSTGISAFAYWNLREYLGLSTENIQIPDFYQFLARVDEDILERFHCDCKLLSAPWSGTQKWSPRDKYIFNIPASVTPIQDNGAWVVEQDGKELRMPNGGFFFDGPGFRVDERPEDEVLAITAREAERIFKETDYATMYIGFGAYFNGIDWLCEALLDLESALEENERSLMADIEQVGKVLDSMGEYIQLICMCGDMGMQTGPLCSPELFERVTAPYLKRFCSFIHANSDCKVYLHSCGSIRPLIPILIDCGVDVLNPVQVSAENMDPSDLVRQFGNDIVFWGGGCDTQRVLGTGTPADVASNVRRLVREFKKSSGFIFNQVHNIMGDVPPNNIVAMLDTAYAESFY